MKLQVPAHLYRDSNKTRMHHNHPPNSNVNVALWQQPKRVQKRDPIKENSFILVQKRRRVAGFFNGSMKMQLQETEQDRRELVFHVGRKVIMLLLVPVGAVVAVLHEGGVDQHEENEAQEVVATRAGNPEPPKVMKTLVMIIECLFRLYKFVFCIYFRRNASRSRVCKSPLASKSSNPAEKAISFSFLANS